MKFTESGSVELRATLESGALTIVVTDTGIGIAEGEQEEIFEPFRQMEQGKTRRAGGTGLGLSVSRQLAELLDGDLGVRSEVGVGSVFTLTIPVGAPEPGSPTAGA